MKDIQKKQLAILEKFDEVCQRHGLRYYLAYGTCLGAVREKGFIPWDHDADVLMPVDDAIELEKYQDEFAPRFFVESYRTNPSRAKTSMGVVDLTQRIRDIDRHGRESETYLFMDIYLLYNCPKGRVALLFNVWRSHMYKLLVGGPPKNHGRVAKAAGKAIIWLFGRGDVEKKIKKIEAKLNYKGESDEVCDYYGEDISLCSVIRYKKEWFGEPAKLEFEGRYFDGPSDPDKYLTRRYGDYMVPPSRESIDREEKIELI